MSTLHGCAKVTQPCAGDGRVPWISLACAAWRLSATTHRKPINMQGTDSSGEHRKTNGTEEAAWCGVCGEYTEPRVSTLLENKQLMIRLAPRKGGQVRQCRRGVAERAAALHAPLEFLTTYPAKPSPPLKSGRKKAGISRLGRVGSCLACLVVGCHSQLCTSQKKKKSLNSLSSAFHWH